MVVANMKVRLGKPRGVLSILDHHFFFFVFFFLFPYICVVGFLVFFLPPPPAVIAGAKSMLTEISIYDIALWPIP